MSLPVNEPPFEAVLDVDEAARLLQVSESLIRGLARRGEIPARKAGREWRFSRDALLSWLEHLPLENGAAE